MAFTVTSNSFKDGDWLSKDFVLSADFGNQPAPDVLRSNSLRKPKAA